MAKKNLEQTITDDILKDEITLPKIIKKIKFKTKNQKRFYKAIEKEDNRIIMAHALAGAGKTFISIQKGLELLYSKDSPINKMIIINPTVSVGNEDHLGFLPGDLMEKIAYHNESAFFILKKIIGEAEMNKLISKNKLQFRVLNFLRGVNLESAYVILDEAQNSSPLQLKTLATRISDDSKLIIEGDLSQTDKYRTNGKAAYTKSGFYDVWNRFGGIDGVYQIEFDKNDCIRSGIVKRVLETYEREEQIHLGERNQYEITDYWGYTDSENNEENI
jgi:phosphate starvation-inducible PhoH-like protein